MVIASPHLNKSVILFSFCGWMQTQSSIQTSQTRTTKASAEKFFTLFIDEGHLKDSIKYVS